MGNYLKMADQRRILALLELGWSYRRIEWETGVRRETVARYDPKQAAKADNPSTATATATATGSTAKPAKVSTGPSSAAEPYRELIKAAVGQGLSAQRIWWQDLQLDYGFGHGYASVKRLVRRIKQEHPELADVMEHPPGQEAQVDYFQGPPTFHGESGKWRRPWVFRTTLSCSRHSYEEPLWGPRTASTSCGPMSTPSSPSAGCRPPSTTTT